VTGYGVNGGSRHTGDYVTIAYDAATGARLWVARYGLPGDENGGAAGVTVSPDGSTVLVTGSFGGTPFSGLDTLAYDPATGALLWSAQEAGVQSSAASPIAVSPDSTKVFVLGTDGNREYVTSAYSN
jgi:DNA-binding beta-propeller fold protein YncE